MFPRTPAISAAATRTLRVVASNSRTSDASLMNDSKSCSESGFSAAARRGPTRRWSSSGYSGLQTKLHRWATSDPRRRFDDLFNLVADPAFLVVAWNRVRVNMGARTAGVDGIAPRSVGPAAGV